MASTNRRQQAKPNLASLVMVKQKLGAKDDAESNANQLSTEPKPVAGAQFGERAHYKQTVLVAPTQEPTTKPSTNANEVPKASRQARQIEVKLLDKKMEEIDRKQETSTNQALDTWKGFDSLNYGFNGASIPTPPGTTKQRSPTPPPKKQSAKKPPSPKRQPTPVKQKSPSPKRQPTPVKQNSPKKTRSPSPEKVQPRTQTPPKQKTPTPPATPPKKDINGKHTPSPPPRNEKPIEKTPTPPLPPPRHSKVDSAPPVDTKQSPEQEKPSSVPSTSPVPLFPPIEQKPFEPLPISISNNQRLRPFPDSRQYEMSRPKNAAKSIQRSMDRYRFHVW